MRELSDCGPPQAMAAHKKQQATPKRSTRITSGLANLAAMLRDSVESGTNEKL